MIKTIVKNTTKKIAVIREGNCYSVINNDRKKTGLCLDAAINIYNELNKTY